MFFNKQFCLFSCLCLISFFTISISAKTLQIVTTIEDFASIAKSIGGNLVSTDSIVKGSHNLHNIYPKPSMVMKLRKADMVIRLGVGQDSWFDHLILAAKNPNIFSNKPGYLDASKGITILEIPTREMLNGMGDIHKEGNPHYWLDPNNGKVIAKNIYKKLIQLDPNNEQTYTKNYTIFITELDNKLIEWKQVMTPLQDKRFVIYHKVWTYFFNAFNLTEIGQLEPFPGIPPTLSHIKNLKDNVAQETHTIYVLTANYYPKSPGKLFAKDINAPFYYLPTNVGDKNISSYIELFNNLTEQLTK